MKIYVRGFFVILKFGVTEGLRGIGFGDLCVSCWRLVENKGINSLDNPHVASSLIAYYLPGFGLKV